MAMAGIVLFLSILALYVFGLLSGFVIGTGAGEAHHCKQTQQEKAAEHKLTVEQYCEIEGDFENVD
jgi:hypothetical protein